jgi:hypothetical protein
MSASTIQALAANFMASNARMSGVIKLTAIAGMPAGRRKFNFTPSNMNNQGTGSKTIAIPPSIFPVMWLWAGVMTLLHVMQVRSDSLIRVDWVERF